MSVEPHEPTRPLPHGTLPPWDSAELPEPLAFSVRNAFRIIGPGAILLAASIGGGEWLVGPETVTKHGPEVLWLATLAIVLQVLFNLEAIRYTLYTGEPIISGIMRLRPGCRVWGASYVLLTAMQLGVPALAPACAAPIFGAFSGRMPAADGSDASTLMWITYGVILGTLAILMFGGTIERMLEWASWGMVAYIFIFLIGVNLWFVPSNVWASTLHGFVSFGYWPENIEPILMATFLATAGSGGIGNLTISNWIRDKGFGMGSQVGAIPSAIGAKTVHLSHVGKVFEVNEKNLGRWRTWWRYVVLDQVWLWGLGCFLGMFLNVNLARAIIPPGTDLAKVGAGAFQAKYMAENFWQPLWMLGLLNGFWILFSTQLGNADVLVRTITDTLWVASRRVRHWKDGNIARIYYGILIVFTLWGLIAVRLGTAMQLFKYLGTMAGIVLCIAAVQVFLVNTRLLPPKLRPSWWRRLALLATALLYGCASYIAISSEIKKWIS